MRGKAGGGRRGGRAFDTKHLSLPPILVVIAAVNGGVELGEVVEMV